MELAKVLCCLAAIVCIAHSEASIEKIEQVLVALPEVKDEKASDAEISGEASEIEPRFLPPFAASFSLGVGGNAAQTFSVSGGPDGIGLSQSSSLTDGQNINGKPGFSSSQSSSLAAGLNGISVADSNAFSSNHPLYGQNAQANGNSFALGQANAAAHGDVINGQATSGAQSSVGSTHSQASSAAGTQGFAQPTHYRPHHNGQLQYRPSPGPGWNYNQPSYGNGYGGDYNNYYNHNRQPKLTITVSDNNNNGRYRPGGGWYEVPDDSWRQPDWCRNYQGYYRDPRCRGPRVTVNRPSYRPVGNYRPYYENIRDTRENPPSLQISQASASSSAQGRPGGLSIGQASSQSQGGRRPSSLTINQAQSSGNAQAHAHGASGSINNRPDGLHASLSSSSVSANSRPGGSAQGLSISSSDRGHSSTQTTGSSSGGGSTHGSANAGSVVAFPGPSSGPSHHQIVPQEFVRSARTGKKRKSKSKEEDPWDELLTDLTDTVYDILDY